MNRYFFGIQVGLALVAISALALPTRCLAGERPYRSGGTAHFVSPTGDFVGTGSANHLGPYTEVGNASISPIGEVNAWSIYTSPSGHELHAVIIGQIDPFGAINATVTYVGGTGRFADASGSATLSGQIQLDGSLVVSVVGTIDY